MSRQRELVFRTWGGARKGAGRTPVGPRPGVPHVRRPSLARAVPLHLTMKVAGIPSLRAERCINVLRRAFAAGKERFGFRLVQYAVQPNHLHLIVEAPNRRALSSGARGLAIRIARRVNQLLGRVGRVFADRYHAVALTSPRQVRRALAYVLLEQRRHAAQRGRFMSRELDPCSSAPRFGGFKGVAPRAGPWDGTVVDASVWLLTSGWRSHGLIDPAAVPGTRHELMLSSR